MFTLGAPQRENCKTNSTKCFDNKALQKKITVTAVNEVNVGHVPTLWHFNLAGTQANLDK